VEDNNVDTDQSNYSNLLGPLYCTGPGPMAGTDLGNKIFLTQLDLDMIHAAVTQQIHGKAVGASASWSNPASNNWGSIRLVKKLALKDQQCEELEYTMRTARPEIYSEHYHFTSCLQPDGTWKIA
jgi:surface antigen